jgi:hypothetical protein
VPFAVREQIGGNFSVGAMAHQKEAAMVCFSIQGVAAKINRSDPKHEEVQQRDGYNPYAQRAQGIGSHRAAFNASNETV